MILKQYFLGCLAHASYLVADERTKVAAVIDPQRDVDAYLEEARRLGVTIRHVFLTHFHADFVAGHLELRERTGARIHLGAQARADYAFTPLSEGEVVEFGDVRLRILETPGHTPEGISIVVHDLAQDPATPRAVFTGDTLFVGDVGRPDLMASIGITARELAGSLYDSLHTKLLALPDATVVYPAHGAGSMCGKNLGKETFSTIGEQRRFNYALQARAREEFVDLVTADQPEAPAYFGHDAVLNRQERTTLEASLERALVPLALERVLALQREGALVLDVREPADFAAAHLAGSINIGLSGKFATWAGTLYFGAKKLVLVAPPGKEREAATRLGRVGIDGVVGYLAGGVEAVAGRPELVSTVARTSVQDLARSLADGAGPLVVDIRTRQEREAGHIAGSVWIPLPHLLEHLAELPRGRELALVCRSGYRSSIAASQLLARGIRNVRDVVGGMEAWTAKALPTTAATGSCSA